MLVCFSSVWLQKSYKKIRVVSQEPVTFSRSGSSKPSANSLLSITEEAATSSGVDPLIDGEAVDGAKEAEH